MNKQTRNTSKREDKTRSAKYFVGKRQLAYAIKMDSTSRLPFPVTLHKMLEAVADANETSIVSWTADGCAFMVHEKIPFMEVVAPYFFKHSKYKSFQRQLYWYGFKSIQGGEAKGAYFHPDFRRGDMDSCSRIVRTNVKKTSKASDSILEMGFVTSLTNEGSSDNDSTMTGQDGHNNKTICLAPDKETTIDISRETDILHWLEKAGVLKCYSFHVVLRTELVMKQ